MSTKFTKLVDAIAHARHTSDLMNEPRYVLKGYNGNQRILWVCGPVAKRELWDELTPVHVCEPQAKTV
jgi:hypothetical protein